MPVKTPDKGLPLSSRVDFTIPSPFAREHLYYLIQYRRYQCVPGYEVKQDFLNMYLCAYVRSGSLHAFCGEQSADAAAGQLVRMDCRLPTGTASPSRPSFSGFTFPAAKARLQQCKPLFPRIPQP